MKADVNAVDARGRTPLHLASALHDRSLYYYDCLFVSKKIYPLILSLPFIIGPLAVPW